MKDIKIEKVPKVTFKLVPYFPFNKSIPRARVLKDVFEFNTRSFNKLKDVAVLIKKHDITPSECWIKCRYKVKNTIYLKKNIPKIQSILIKEGIENFRVSFCTI